jgi:hypothetical protein
MADIPSTPASSSITTSPPDEEDAAEGDLLVTDESGSVALEENAVVQDGSANQSEREDDYEDKPITIPYVSDPNA